MPLLRERRSDSPVDPAGEPPTQRHEFEVIWANLGKQRQQLFVIAALALTALLLVLGSYVHLATSSRFVPYLYVVDRSGEVLALGSSKPTTADADPIVYFALESFISGVRSVFTDQNAERYVLQRAYAYLPRNTPGADSEAFVARHLQANDPRTLAATETRTVELISILKVPATAPQAPKAPRTWRIRWRETRTPVVGGSLAITEWEAFVTVRVSPKRFIEAFDPNPMGVWVDHISWGSLSTTNSSASQP